MTRSLRVFGVAFGALLLVLISLLAMMVFTEAGFRATGRLLDVFSNHSLRITQPRGTIAGGMYAQQISYDSPLVTLKASDLALQVRWQDLWRGQLTVVNMVAQSLVIDKRSDNKPFVMPAHLHLPVSIDLQAVRINELVFNGNRLENLAVKAAYDRRTYRLSSLSGQHVFGESGRVDVTANGTVEDTAPFESAVELSAQGLANSKPWMLDTTISGPALNPAVSLNAQADKGQQQLQATALLRLLDGKAALPFDSLQITGKNLNPQAWVPHWPTARLGISVSMQPAVGDLVKGMLELSNQTPLPWDKGGIPVKQLSSSLSVKNPQGRQAQATLNLDTVALSAGRVTGVVEADATHLDARLKAQAVALEQLYSTLQPIRVEGDVNAQVLFKDGTQALQVNLVESGVTNKPRTFVASVKNSPAQLDILDARLLDGTGKASVKGQLLHNASQTLALELALERLNPARWARLPAGQLNVSGTVNGPLKPAARLNVQLAIRDSQLNGEPFSGSAKGQYGHAPFELDQLAVDLNLAGNRLTAQGAYGRSSDRLQFRVDAPRLDTLGRVTALPLKGQINAQGFVEGKWPALGVDMQATTRDLQWADLLKIPQAQLQLSMGQAPASAWNGSLQASQLQFKGDTKPRVESIRAVLSGQRQLHELSVDVKTLYKPFGRRTEPMAAQLKAAGGFATNPYPQWQGKVSALSVQGLWSPMKQLQLREPVALHVASDTLRLGAFQLGSASQMVMQVREVVITPAQLKTSGNWTQLDVPRISPILGEPFSVEPRALKLNGQWDVDVQSTSLRAAVGVDYASGDLDLLEDRQVPVGLKALKASWVANNQASTLSATVQSELMGQVETLLSLALNPPTQPSSRQWTLAKNAPMTGRVKADLNNMAWLGPVINPNLRTDGQVIARVEVTGSPNAPQASGTLEGQRLELSLINEGVRLSDGRVLINFNDTEAVISNATFTAGNRQAPGDRIRELGPLISNSGQLSVSGHWPYSGLGGEVIVDMKGLGLLQRSDRWMMLSGKTRLLQARKAGDPLQVIGTLRADGAYIELPKTAVESLGDDVLIRGRTDTAGAGSGSKAPVLVDVTADLGDQFYFSGSGLKSRLSGVVRLKTDTTSVAATDKKDGVRDNRRLRATGSIRTEGGTFDAYGQQLVIEKGILNFQGAVDNPGLNVRAVRKGLAVEAGVEVSGSAKRPRIRLVSDPAVPDSEKLSWLVLGQSADRVNAKDSGLLLRAATAIFGGDASDAGLTRQLQNALGIDNIGVSTGSLSGGDTRSVGSKVVTSPGASPGGNTSASNDPLLNQRIVSVGKRLSDSVYLAYDQSITTAASVVKLTYQLTRQLSLIGRAGADNAVDVLYQLSFD